jgi:hypothetical protein
MRKPILVAGKETLKFIQKKVPANKSNIITETARKAKCISLRTASIKESTASKITPKA